jgi:hypothetical protein
MRYVPKGFIGGFKMIMNGDKLVRSQAMLE